MPAKPGGKTTLILINHTVKDSNPLAVAATPYMDVSVNPAGNLVTYHLDYEMWLEFGSPEVARGDILTSSGKMLSVTIHIE